MRFTWYTSPAAIAARIARTPASNSASASELRPGVGRAARATAGPATGRAGRTSAKRAQTGAPSNGSTTAQNPADVERGEIVGDVDEVGRQPTARRRPSGHVGGDGSGHGGQRTITPRPCRHPFHPPGRPSPPVHVEFTEEQDALRKVVRDFAEAEIAPHAEAWDRDHHFPVDVVRAMGELGLFGIPFPEEYGGGGGDLTTLCIAIEELARVDQSMAITLEAGVGLGANPIHRFGTEEQKQAWLPDLCAGRTLGGFGLTEPEAGQRRRRHPHDGRARRGGRGVGDQRREGVHHQLGHRHHVARHGHRRAPGRARSARSSSRPARPGFEVQPPYRKMGWHASDTHGLTFADCRVPEANLLGERGRGFAQFLAILDEGRIAISALAVGLHPGLPRALHAVRQRPPRLRQADRRQPGRGLPGAPTWP